MFVSREFTLSHGCLFRRPRVCRVLRHKILGLLFNISTESVRVLHTSLSMESLMVFACRNSTPPLHWVSEELAVSSTVARACMGSHSHACLAEEVHGLFLWNHGTVTMALHRASLLHVHTNMAS